MAITGMEITIHTSFSLLMTVILKHKEIQTLLIVKHSYVKKNEHVNGNFKSLISDFNNSEIYIQCVQIKYSNIYMYVFNWL